ncbi:transposase IS1182 family protein [Flammeovirgaceae bacterium 311]|nr:transposase IS1182 family protein [Flammeovirgaceae bacterium 311]AHM59102.1 transposase IS1182 family protein [Flammeovirgaceae bacterium 311]AHM59109.1 transposase IS1182 family protein [Flammeovirgaceae bacterium 311]AHM59111.1 transposase IS1182 family protein [Flammeovirgaceae bacterium 311]AHM59125.1 transposase IS1182 family protein [Flammeovirgaceae bacterium 311]
MHHLTGRDRNQTFSTSLEASISADNPVRVIDAFVDALPLLEMGFKGVEPKATGRPSFDPAHLLKLYLYGYYNRIRSSRKLETECRRNLEVQWLLQGLCPAYHTIADFRKEHPQQLKQVFKAFVAFLNDAHLLKGKYVAIDGTKIRAVNSRKNNYNQKKIERQLSYIQEKIDDYLDLLEEEDQKEAHDVKGSRADIEVALKHLEKRKLKYEQMEKEVAQSDDGQVSTSDKESRALIQHHNVVEVSYNSQAAVDSKHCLIIHYQALNKNDSKALAPTALAAKQALGKKRITVLADKAYHSGEQLSECLDNGIITIVAYKEPARDPVPTAAYYLEQFHYDEKKDHYICPKGEVLSSNGSWYEKHKVSLEKKNASPYMVKHYKTKACLCCAAKALCTINKAGRLIERSEHAGVIKSNNQRVMRQKEVYRKRQAIVEHPFGTIKRAWGYSYTLMKGLKKVDGELGLIFTCYNLRRAVSILSVPKLLKLLKSYTKWPVAALSSLTALYLMLFS